MDVKKIMKIAIPLGISAVLLGFLFKGYKPPTPPTPPEEGIEITKIEVE